VRHLTRLLFDARLGVDDRSRLEARGRFDALARLEAGFGLDPMARFDLPRAPRANPRARRAERVELPGHGAAQQPDQLQVQRGNEDTDICGTDRHARCRANPATGPCHDPRDEAPKLHFRLQRPREMK
jgi:hypothetical protein